MKDPAIGGGVVDAEAQPALLGWEGVGDDGRRVGEEHGAADALADPHGDEPEGAGGSVEPGHGQQHREDGEDGETDVKIRTRPKMSPTRPSVTTSTASTTHEPHQHPEHVAGVAGRERVEVDAPEDVRQRDEHDRLVDEDHQGAQGDRRRAPTNGNRDGPGAGGGREHGRFQGGWVQGRGAHFREV